MEHKIIIQFGLMILCFMILSHEDALSICAELSLGLGPIADDGLNLVRLTIAPELNADALTDGQLADQIDQMIFVADDRVIDLENHIVSLQTGYRRRGAGIDLVHQSA